MALQAQYPSNAFSPDLGGRARNDFMGDLKMQRVCNDTTAAISDPQSQLTCNAAAAAAASRKRGLDDPSSMATGLSQLFHEQSRLFRSAGTSTSGRPAAVSISSLAPDVVPNLYHQSIEIDAIVRLQTERLRWEMEEARKRHHRDLLWVVEQHVSKRLREKETELECASRRNAELEEKVGQMSAENQIWFNAAVNSEAVVSSLRTSIEQLLLQNAASAAVPPVTEGFGECDGVSFPADDAQSCCFNDETVGKLDRAGGAAAMQRESEELRRRRACRVCREEEVCVLLLPCRHLCLCKECEPRIDTCPVCHSLKNACLQIFMS